MALIIENDTSQKYFGWWVEGYIFSPEGEKIQISDGPYPSEDEAEHARDSLVNEAVTGTFLLWYLEEYVTWYNWPAKTS